MSPTRIVTTALALTVLTSGTVAHAQFGRGSVFRKLFDRGSSTSRQTSHRPPASVSAARPTRAKVSAGADAHAADPVGTGFSTLDSGVPTLSIFGATLAFIEGAATVHAVEPGGDAQRAGLQPGDQLDTISGLEVDQLDVLSAMGEVVSRGEELPLGLLRPNASGEFEPLEAALVVTQGLPTQVSIRALQSSSAAEATSNAASPELGSILHSSTTPASADEEPEEPEEAAVEAGRESTHPTVAYKGWSRSQLAARVQALEQELRTQQATISNQAAELRTLRR